MQSILRIAPRASRSRLLVPASSSQFQPHRYAHQSYGDDQSGHPQSDEKNPKSHLEHPGPEGPATQGSSAKKTQSSSGRSSSSTDKGKPAIQQPKSAAENDDPEVRKHNEEMRQRSEKTANQLSEEDNKVDPKFWKGDVGDPNKAKD